jgi:hypothetical protein
VDGPVLASNPNYWDGGKTKGRNFGKRSIATHVSVPYSNVAQQTKDWLSITLPVQAATLGCNSLQLNSKAPASFLGQFQNRYTKYIWCNIIQHIQQYGVRCIVLKFACIGYGVLRQVPALISRMWGPIVTGVRCNPLSVQYVVL